MSGPSPFDYARHVQIYVTRRDSSLCYFGGVCSSRTRLSCVLPTLYPAPRSSFLCLSLPTAVATLPLSVFHGLTFLCALQTKVNEHNPEIVFQPAMVGRKIPWLGACRRVGETVIEAIHISLQVYPYFLVLSPCTGFLL